MVQQKNLETENSGLQWSDAVSLHSCCQTFQRHDKTSGNINPATQRHIPDSLALHQKHCGNLKSHKPAALQPSTQIKLKQCLEKKHWWTMEICLWGTMLAQEAYYTVKSDTNRLTKLLNVNIRYMYLHCIHTWKSSWWQEIWCITSQPWKCRKSNWNQAAVIAHGRAMTTKFRIHWNVLEVTQV